jgi:peptide/nickel transport system permease protein
MSIGNVGDDLEVIGDAGEEQLPEAAKVIQGRSPWQLAYERLKRDRASVVCAIVIVVIILVAIFAPIFAHLTHHGVNEQFRETGENPEGFPTGPGHTFLLGADDQGRDVLVRIAYGARVSLLIGVVTTILTVTIGAIFGLMAGYLGTVVDSVISRIIDVTLSIPFLLFGIALASVIGGGTTVVIVVLAGFGWSSVARIVRGQVISIREREYIEAARSLGASSWRIMFIDILPNVMAQVIVYASLLIPATIVGESTLSYLGIGVQAPRADWGAMIASSQNGGIYEYAWWFLLFPSLALLITTLAFNIFGDGVRDAFDPRSDRMFV